MKTFKNKKFIKRDYECSQVVFAQAEENPQEDLIEDELWEECKESEIQEMKCEHFYTINNVRYLGYL